MRYTNRRILYFTLLYCLQDLADEKREEAGTHKSANTNAGEKPSVKRTRGSLSAGNPSVAYVRSSNINLALRLNPDTDVMILISDLLTLK